jgi:shikimate dehydrogenase
MNARYAVFGQPIAHSLSPRIHAAFAAQCGLRIDYRAIEAGHDDFARALDAFARDGGAGANVTRPLKQDALAACASLSARAARCGSVNTLLREAAGWHGDSTDGAGLLRDLRHRHGLDPGPRTRVLLLGAGGAAHAVAFALVDAGVGELVIANRGMERAIGLARAVGDAATACDFEALRHRGSFDLLVDATSIGHTGATLPLPRTLVTPHTLCYCLAYGAAAHAFLAWARAANARAVDGLGMLVEQAAESFALWFSQRPDSEAVLRGLRAESGVTTP